MISTCIYALGEFVSVHLNPHFTFPHRLPFASHLPISYQLRTIMAFPDDLSFWPDSLACTQQSSANSSSLPTQSHADSNVRGSELESTFSSYPQRQTSPGSRVSGNAPFDRQPLMKGFTDSDTASWPDRFLQAMKDDQQVCQAQDTSDGSTAASCELRIGEPVFID